MMIFNNLKNKNLKFKAGLILIGVSTVFFILLMIFPFLNIEKGIKITLTTVSFVLAEGLFYIGGFLLGKEVIKKYKPYLNPMNWFKSKSVIPAMENKDGEINENGFLKNDK